MERFAIQVGRPLRPWQRWVAIHAGELLPDGTPRFEQILLLVARQNGKTHLLYILIAFWLFIEQHAMILGVSVNLTGASIPWNKVVELIETTPELRRWMPKQKNLGIYYDNNNKHIETADRCTYALVPAGRGAARGRTVDRLVVDELREQKDRETYDAVVPTMQALDYAQCWFLSNQGDERSIVLNDLHTAALAFINAETDEDREDLDDSLGLFEYSAEDNCDLFDVEGWKAANPSLGHVTKMFKRLHNKAKLAMKIGPTAVAGFRTEYLCQKVKSLNGAIDPIMWNVCEDSAPLPKSSGIALVCDISLDGKHGTLMAAETLSDGRRRVEVVKAWEGVNVPLLIEQELPGLAQKVKPRVVGWMPMGPMAVLGAKMKQRKGVRPWLAGIPIVEITEVPEACMGFSADVDSELIAHNGDPLLTLHALSVSKYETGDRWKFSRKDGEPCDAVYAAAGAVHLVKTLPAPVKPMLVSVGGK
ncbi:hypothetical protein AB0J83_41485 [Actinoplanes sp. NPDC049596]|uniref:hypothetical protein n=1 Tax=unclassified Actinoplanes TaxID=2626549 RepID=UPI003415E96A